MKKLFFLLSFTFLGTVYAQDAIEYKTPPKEIFDLVKKETLKNNCKFLIATPPCQGMSSLGKKDYEKDERNYL